MFGTSNFFDGRVSEASHKESAITLGDGTAFSSAHTTDVPVGDVGCLSVRPEQIRLSRSQVPGGLEATVQNRIFLGEHTEYVVRHNQLGSITALAPRQTDAGLSTLGTGDKVWVHWTPDAALILRPD